MTASTTGRSRSNRTSSKPEDTEKIETPDTESENVQDSVSTETPETENVETEKPRIPEGFDTNPIIKTFAEDYLKKSDLIAEYNKSVLQRNDSEWNAKKVLDKSKEFASPDDPSKIVQNVKTARDAFEAAAAELSKKRAELIAITAKELGIELSSTAERDPEKEEQLSEERKVAIVLGEQLKMMATVSPDKSFNTMVEEFLAANPLPAIGRDQVRSFSETKGTTPKYRVTITVTNKDGHELVKEKGFTKTALTVSKHYPRGEGIKADKIRQAWEAAGNTADKTVVEPVEFIDNDLTFSIVKTK